VDRRRPRPRADEPRGLPDAGRLELACPPQRREPADGLDRRAGHPLPVHRRGAVLRVRPRRDQRRGEDHAGALPLPAAVGPPRPAAGLRARRHRRHPAAELPVGRHRRRADRPTGARGRGAPRHARAGPRRRPLHQPDHRRRRTAHHPRRDAPGPPQHRDRAAPRGRLLGLAGLRRHRHRHRRDKSWSLARGDLFVVPSWQPLSVRSEASPSDSDSGALDLFRFSDTPIFEALHLDRVAVEVTHS
jgi:hypothetical protein